MHVFKIKNKPKKNKTIKIHVERLGHLNHIITELHKRHARTPRRKAISEQLKTSTTVDYYYKKFATVADEASLGGYVT